MCIRKHKISTIFRTIQLEDEYGIVNTKIVSALKARKIAQEQLNASLAEESAQLEKDIIALKRYESACQSGEVTTKDFEKCMSSASVKAQTYAVRIKEGTGSSQLFAEQQKKTQTQLKTTANATKEASVEMKALRIALNMIAFTLISEVIRQGVSWLNSYIDAAKSAKDASEALTSKIKDFNSTASENTKL